MFTKSIPSRLLAIAAMTALFHPIVEAEAHHRLSWRWDSYSVAVINNAGPAWEGPARLAIGQWNAGSPVKLKLVSGSLQPCAVVPGSIVLCEERSEYLGVASPYASPDGRLESVVVSLSPRALALETTATGTVCHELGHALGLGHQPTDDSCMRSRAGPTAPNEHDYEQLHLIYSSGRAAPACPLPVPQALCLFRR